VGPGSNSCGCCRASSGVPMRAALKDGCNGSGALDKGGVGIVGGLGARKNVTAAGGATWDDGRPVVDALVLGFKSCGAMWTSGDP